MKKIIFVILLVFVAAFISACAQTPQETVQPPAQNTPTVQVNPAPAQENNNTSQVQQPESYVNPSTSVEPTLTYSGTIIAGTTDPYIDFNQADFDKAVAAGKLVLLYFYDKDNPICKVEEVEAVDAFNELDVGKIVGFRVHYGDGLDDNYAKAIAAKYNVKQDHIKLVIKDGKVVDTGIDSWNKAYFESRLRSFL